MKVSTLGPGHARYVLPFPRLARVLGLCLLASAPPMLLTAAAAGLRGGTAPPIAAAGILDLLLGLVLLGGTRYIEADRARRRLLVGLAVFGSRLPGTTRALPLSTGARLRVESNAAATLHDVDYASLGGRRHLARCATAASALGFARSLAEVLQIEIERTKS
ncbi:MAG TPA: hypothetical protein PJ986_10255 [Gammaproteobacteria bacterium]|nr:hypothetical protein [Gammaproteobacteria bacterium]